MRPHELHGGRIAAGLLALLIGGCSLLSRPQAPPTRYFVLTSERAAGAERPKDLAIGIGPFTFPPYLERPQMVGRTEPNQLVFSQFNRWAEPVASGFLRVLAEDVGRQVGTDQIVLFPWYQIPLDYQVKGEILRFETDAEGDAVLECIWTIYDPTANEYRATRHSTLRRATSGDSADEVAAALSGLIGDLAATIAKEDVLQGPARPRRRSSQRPRPMRSTKLS